MYGEIGNIGISAMAVACSSRKSKLPTPLLQAESLPCGTQREVAKEWIVRIGSIPKIDLVQARDLYMGRSYLRTRTLSEEFGCSLFILSAGLGLVREKTSVPSYNLTVSSSASQALHERVRPFLDPPVWWDAMQSGPFASPMSLLCNESGRILVALTRSYAEMVGPSLSALSLSQRTQLRILGFGLTPSALPLRLHPQVMVYDARLDSVIPGTGMDAVSRALTHFAYIVRNVPMQSPREDQRLIDDALDIIEFPSSPTRMQVNDVTLMQHVRKLAKDGLTSSCALRRLRDEMGIACEEKRFRRIYGEVCL